MDNQPLYRGKRVALLAVVWLLGRVGMALDDWMPGAALVDLAFLPLLALFIGRDVVRARNVRNYPVAGMLLGLWGLWGLNLLWQFGHPGAALHALTAGAMGVMILAVASRAALGHSGRPLQPAKATVLAYWLVIVGALVRTLVNHPHATLAAGVLWAAGYAVFAAVYWPILTRPRVDGQAPKFPTEISRGPRFDMRSAGLLAALDKEQGAERARRTLVRRSERSDAVTQRCAQSGGSRKRASG